MERRKYVMFAVSRTLSHVKTCVHSNYACTDMFDCSGGGLVSSRQRTSRVVNELIAVQGPLTTLSWTRRAALSRRSPLLCSNPVLSRPELCWATLLEAHGIATYVPTHFLSPLPERARRSSHTLGRLSLPDGAHRAGP